MILHQYLKVKKKCALCLKEMPKWTSALYDPAKSVEKRYVHTSCYIELQKKRGTYKEPPF